jgi:diguanylate cyclase (GGDEF)-like protein
MVNLRTLSIVVICLSALAVTCDSQSAEKKKVKVTSLSAQKQEQVIENVSEGGIIPRFATLDELLAYKDEFLATEPENVLNAFKQFQINHFPSPSDETTNKLDPNTDFNINLDLTAGDTLDKNDPLALNIDTKDSQEDNSGPQLTIPQLNTIPEVAVIPKLDVIPDLSAIPNLSVMPDVSIAPDVNISPEQKFQFSLALSEVHLALSELDTALAQLETLPLSDLDIVQKITVLEKKAQILSQKNDFFNAVRYLTEGNKLAVTNDLSRQSILSALQLSEIYVTLSDKDKILYWQHEARDLLAAQDDLGLLIEASILLAKQQQDIGQHLNATRTLINVVDLVAEKKYYSVEASLRLRLSENFKTAEQYVNAEQELERAYKLAVKSRNQEQQMVAILRLIDTYAVQNKFNNAKPLLKAAKRLERFLTTVKDKRDYQLAKAQVLAGTSQYKQALNILDNLDMSDIEDEKAKQDLAIKLLDLKSNWMVLNGKKQSGIQLFKKSLDSKLAQQETSTTIKLDFLMANYKYDVAQAKEELAEVQKQLLEYKKQNEKLSQPKEDLIDSLYNNKELLAVSVILLFAIVYLIFRLFKPKKSKRIFLDPVTGANNHNYFTKHVKLLMQSNTPFSLIMFDIDNMRKVNDKLGFELGDKLLALVVARLDSRLGSNKFLVRLSDDKFIVIAKDFSLKQAFSLAEVLRKELNSNKFYINNLGINLSASFGVSYCYSNKNIDAIKDDVKNALDKAKAKGGNITQAMDFC